MVLLSTSHKFTNEITMVLCSYKSKVQDNLEDSSDTDGILALFPLEESITEYELKTRLPSQTRNRKVYLIFNFDFR